MRIESDSRENYGEKERKQKNMNEKRYLKLDKEKHRGRKIRS